jgi:hypothetical protein
MTAHSSPLGWVNGWQRSAGGWSFQGLVRRDRMWETHMLQPTEFGPKRRVFEPDSAAFAHLASRSFRVRIADLSLAAPLLHPDQLVAAHVSGARRTRHSIYTVEVEGRAVYLPALLLLQELWAWTDGAAEALLTPNSLAMSLQRDEADGQLTVRVTGPLARLGSSDTTLRRLCWLAQCEDAAASWASVLTCAHQESLNLRLPRVNLDAWAWGVELPAGTLVAELSAVSLGFELPRKDCWVQIARTRTRCPDTPERRTGLVST